MCLKTDKADNCPKTNCQIPPKNVSVGKGAGLFMMTPLTKPIKSIKVGVGGARQPGLIPQQPGVSL